jgi:uroporphyrinogen-III decarboxylase
MDELFAQMETIEKEWGPIHGYVNWQGVLNNAFNIRGQEIFTDIYERPQFVHDFFDLITDVMIAFATRVQKRQRESGFEIDQFSVANCVVNMISPADYAEFVFPRDRRIAENFKRFGVHTCNWDITPYIEPLSELPKVGYLDMGMVSDMPRVKAAFPETRRAVIYSPWKLHQASIEEIRQDTETIYRELAPCDLVMADIQHDTPDERVRALLDICRELEQHGEETENVGR